MAVVIGVIARFACRVFGRSDVVFVDVADLTTVTGDMALDTVAGGALVLGLGVRIYCSKFFCCGC